MFTIVEKRALGEAVTLMSIHAPLIAGKARAGQFVVLRIDEQGERIPLTIADCDARGGEVTIIFQHVGRTTKMLSTLEVGDSILDFVGPLGQPTDLQGVRNAVVVGGGVGCAIAYPQAKELKRLGAQVEIIAGFRTHGLVILEEEMRGVSDRFTVATDDGSYGRQGFVTDALRETLASREVDLVVAIGPVPMMRAVSNLTKEFGVRTLVSLNPIMVDGTGMCGGCRVTVGGQMKFACIEGPDFDGHQVDFDELMRRNALYREQEAHDAAHVCRLTGGIRHE